MDRNSCGGSYCENIFLRVICLVNETITLLQLKMDKTQIKYSNNMYEF